jgi:cyclophilin family peptidyl-prolyl cis-trans isomerase
VREFDASGSHGSQFVITTGPMHYLDGQSVVFGEVVEGMDVVTAISQSPLEEGTPDRPLDPTTITAVEVL